MPTRIFLSLALLVAMRAWSQVSTTEGGVGLAMTDQMLTPAPVNGEAYPTTVGSDTRSNYLRGGLIITTAYSDNVLGDAQRPVSDVNYSIYPTIALDKATPRLHLRLNYSPGFTIYQQTSVRNQTNQFVTFDLQYRLSPHVTVSLQDSLQETSNLFDQPDPFSGVAITGSPQAPLYALIAPVEGQIGNGANAELRYQLSRNGQVGAAATFTNLHFFKTTNIQGLYDSNSTGGSAFYNHRLSKRNYFGVTYLYSRILAYPVNAESEIHTNTVLLFYTLYLKPTFSVSFTGGPLHYDVLQKPLPVYSSWSPTLTGSMGWQRRHTNLAASFTRIVGGGGGLVGAFQSDRASAFARWQFARTWSLGSAGTYLNNKNVTPSSFLTTEGGHSIFGTVSAHHQFTQHFDIDFGYTRVHQTYSGIPVISNAPNTNREFVTLSYTFARPLGG
jgi:hypothetical protein